MKKKELKNISSNSESRDRVANLSKVGNPTPALFEVIKVQNRQLQNIEYHNNRMSRALNEVFGVKKPILLEQKIIIPEQLNNQIYKCRVIYSNKIEKIEFEPYQPRKINSLKIVTHDTIDYSVKYYDRKIINELYKQRPPMEPHRGPFGCFNVSHKSLDNLRPLVE